MSAPVFHNVMDGALRLMDVPPDDIDTWLAAQAKADAKRSAEAPAAAADAATARQRRCAAPLPAPTQGGAQ